jgi:hypothetical protein
MRCRDGAAKVNFVFTDQALELTRNLNSREKAQKTQKPFVFASFAPFRGYSFFLILSCKLQAGDYVTSTNNSYENQNLFSRRHPSFGSMG